ncbi:MAG: 4-(cytidine 5'-diphospho)-2-C-methyl-D-erythritol kinase [Flavitalea sp.]
MISFPNCKINLGLHIVSKRTDGYHNLETVFYPLPLTDILEILPKDQFNEAADNSINLKLSGLPVAGDQSDNLCVKAWKILKKDHPALPPVNAFLYKNIPMGAGLGGGSSDGAFMLKMLNDHFKLNVSAEKLAVYALSLGSDCPFFLENKPVFASGRGEIFEKTALDLSRNAFLIVNPGLHISTARSFAGIRVSPAPVDLRQAIREPIATWKEIIKNDFEQTAFEIYPQLEKIKEELYEAGALYASMSGSGSCFYGIFENNEIPDISGAIKIPALSV